MKTSPSDIYIFARAAGLGKVSKLTIEPMVVARHQNPFDDSSPITQSWIVPDGPCGFAWVDIRQGHPEFVRFLRSKGIVDNGRSRSVKIWISEFGQSFLKKEAYAQGFVEGLRAYGINCSYGSRLD